ncbi:MAG: hypothetical protein ACR2RL_04750 [Gammaproteobacteria bacterium]
MELFNLQIVALTSISLLLVLVGIWSARMGAARLIMLGLFAGTIGVVFGASSNLLGQARPVALEWLAPQVEEAVILSGHLMEGHGIFLTVVWDDNEPQLYVLPWDIQTAQQLQKALMEAEENGTEAKMRMPLHNNLAQHDDMLFYAPPQPQPVPKKVPSPGIRLG